MTHHDASALDGLRHSGRGTQLKMTGTLLALSQLSTTAAPAPATGGETAADGTTTLPQMVVEAERARSLYKPENVSLPEYTVPLVDVPQTVAVIPREVMEEQGVTNLREVLKNVPGISIQAGEGGVPPGDNLAIRGFNARTDLFVDGVRDFGGYSRDPFNIEQVEVVKGPSSTSAGRGSTGGSVNLSSKMPFLENRYGILLGGGTDDFRRATFDVNQVLPQLPGAAVRINGMHHEQSVAGRDFSDQDRWGIAPSVSFGLGTETRFTLSYFRLQQNNLPDYGLPWVPYDNPLTPGNDNVSGLPSGRPPVSYGNWYGLLGRDHEKTETDIVTAIFEHDFTESLKLRNLTRFGQNHIDLSVTAPRFFNLTSAPLPAGTPPTAIRRSDWKNRDQEDWIFSNQTDLRYDFQTGRLKHELVASIEAAHEESENRLREDRNIANAPVADLFNPVARTGYIPDIIYNGAVNRTEADSFALSLFDTVEINDCWMVSGGVRYDYFDVDYRSQAATVGGVPGAVIRLGRTDEMVSYRGAVTFKPAENGSIYLGYGTSFNPAAEGLALSDSATASNNVNTDPEESRTVELGTKWELMDDRLLLTGAIFRTDKTNARTEDPTDPTDVVVLDGAERVQGFEVGFTGLITDDWRVIGGYTYLDSEVRSSKNALEEGNRLSNTPENTFSLWTVHDLPKGFQIGLGVNYVDSRFNNPYGPIQQEAPGYTTFDALIGYQLNENVSFRLNGYNLADRDYIDRVGGGHFSPGPGRSVVLTADLTF